MPRRFADLLVLPQASLVALCAIASLAFACSSEPEDADGSGGATGAGGALTGAGGDVGAGGDTSSSGGAASGGASSGGASATGGALSSGGAGTGGDESGAGGDAAGGADSDTGGSDGAGGEDGSGGNEGGGAFALTSPAWTVLDNDACTKDSDVSECGAYPKEHLSNFIQGDNLSPELNWTDPPEGTMSFAVVLHDLSEPLVHWALLKIGADVTGLPAELPGGTPLTDPAGTEQGSAVGGAYFGSGACGNTYEFRLYALSDADFAPANPNDLDAFYTLLESAPEVLGTSFARLRSGPPDCNP